jgi:SAM-dependent methyltransferase
MPQSDGLRSVLSLPRAYALFFDLVGGPGRDRVLVRDYIRARPGDRVLDIGCGPGTLVPLLADVDYVGFDLSPEYIHRAQSKYPDKQFVCERVSAFTLKDMGVFDTVLALGVLHHLDDAEAMQLFQIAHDALKPGGRLVTIDGVWADGQSPIAKYFLSRDRGRFVRRADEYQRLGSASFSQIEAKVRHDLLRIPYSHVILECVR